MSAQEQLAALLLRVAQQGCLKKAVLSKPCDRTLMRAVLTVRQVRGSTVLQLEQLHTDNKATHRNLPLAEHSERSLATLFEEFGQINLISTAGACELRTSKSGKSTLLGGDKLLRALATEQAFALPIEGNNREKERILHGDEPFLRLLEISDANGRIHDKKQSKFRQINRFLELIRDCLSALPSTQELRICDLCCGKSYLSFATYHYFVNVLGRQVRMSGVDLKPDVVAHCNRVARELHFDGLEFICEDVSQYDAGGHVHLVISLHACDIATDLVLSRAVAWGTEVILATPCCHHELNHKIQSEALAFVTEHSMLRQKLCDAATDALRLKKLQARGYRVNALELIDASETPKNILLRAMKKPKFSPTSPEAVRLMEEYEAAKRFLLGEGVAVGADAL